MQPPHGYATREEKTSLPKNLGIPHDLIYLGYNPTEFQSRECHLPNPKTSPNMYPITPPICKPAIPEKPRNYHAKDPFQQG